MKKCIIPYGVKMFQTKVISFLMFEVLENRFHKTTFNFQIYSTTYQKFSIQESLLNFHRVNLIIVHSRFKVTLHPHILATSENWNNALALLVFKSLPAISQIRSFPNTSFPRNVKPDTE